jgi:homoserine O-acetyltransferase
MSFNKVAMEAIRRDPRFKHGNYARDAFKEEGLDGLAIGRIAGHISYLSPDSMDDKFGRNYVSNDGLFELFGRYEVERYMEYNTNNFSRIFDPLSYLYIVKAINTFNLTRGYDSLHDAISRIKANVHLISFTSDYLFFPSEMEHIAKMMERNGQSYTYLEVQSDYGHDAFLVELEKFEENIREVL